MARGVGGGVMDEEGGRGEGEGFCRVGGGERKGDTRRVDHSRPYHDLQGDVVPQVVSSNPILFLKMKNTSYEYKTFQTYREREEGKGKEERERK